MKHIAKKSAGILFLAALLIVPVASEAQLGGGIVYDPTNYRNACSCGTYQLQQQLAQLQTDLSARCFEPLQPRSCRCRRTSQNMPARYQAAFLPVARLHLRTTSTETRPGGSAQ